MPTNSTPEPPSRSWTEGQTLLGKGGVKLPRWGSVSQASKILDECDRQLIYDLIGAGAVSAYKRRPERSNSHWRVDLLSVWNHKQRQLENRPGGA